MPVKKFSEITLAVGQPALTDTLIGVAAGPTDLQWTLAFIKAAIAPDFTGFANPTASVGLTAVNGSATTAMRSDAAPPLSQSIAPNMTAAWTWTPSGTNVTPITLTGGTVTASAPLLNMTQTWNNSGVVFRGHLLNVTATANAANSLLYDYQAAGVSKGALDVNGVLYVQANPNSTNASYMAISSGGIDVRRTGAGSFLDLQFIVGGSQSFGVVNASPRRVAVINGGEYSWSTDGAINSTPIARLTAPATGAIQSGAADAAAPVAQALRAQSVVAGTANTSGQNWTQRGSLSTGSGTSGDIIFQTGVAPGGGSSTVQATATTALTIKGETQAVVVASGKPFQVGNAFVATPQIATGYIIISDNTGTQYKVSCNP